jgi:hypothetical protein
VAGEATPEDVATIEKYIAYRFGPTIRDPDQWDSNWARSIIRSSNRERAEEIVARYPEVTDAEFAAAEKQVAPLMGEMGQPGYRSWGSSAVVLFIVAAAVGWLAWMAFFSLCAAVLCRGGLLLWALGLTFVRRDGQPASRLRILWRTLVAWSPLVLFPVVFALVAPAFHGVPSDQRFVLLTSVGTAFAACYLALVVWSALLPVRGLPDRLAGTWLVPR